MRKIYAQTAILTCVWLCLFLCCRADACDKKGIGFVHVAFASPSDLLKEMNAHWYYNWNLTGSKDVTGIQFVPMVSGRPSKLQSDLQLLADHGNLPTLLGFNEPDLPARDISVDQAITLWPAIQQAANRLGSPAASIYGPNWLQQFMAQAEGRHFKVDFIAMHYYGPPDAQRFLAIVDQLHEEFNRPIWITEFAVRNADWKTNPDLYQPSDVVNFMRVVLPELERRSYVERFAWWGIGEKNIGLQASQFFQEDGSMTDVGRYYASIEATSSGEVCGGP